METFVKNAVYDDYDRLVQLCDALALPSGFCLLEKRFVDGSSPLRHAACHHSPLEKDSGAQTLF